MFNKNKNTMHIGFVTPEFVTEKYYSGGLANYVYRTAKALVDRGHAVHVITHSEIDRSEFEYGGIHVHRITIDALQQKLNRFTQHRLPATSRSLAISIQAYRKLRQLHLQQSFDIVEISSLSACGLVARLLLHIPYVTRISCYRPLLNRYVGVERNYDERTAEWLEWFQLRLSRHVYAPSSALKQILTQETQISHVQVIRPPFYVETIERDPSVYDQFVNGKPYLLFFGRYQLHKGFHILAQALPQVLKEFPECHTVFVGLDWPSILAPSMEQYARSICHQAEDRLIFIGQIPHSQLYPIIEGARLVVLPSLIDNFPNTCLEAMALGKPVIGTIGASFDEVITDGETGFLVPKGDVKALVAKIKEAWAHPRLDEIGQAARRRVEDFAPERTVQTLLACYKDVVGGHK